MSGLSSFDELEITLRGVPDPVTGYLIDIKEIDAAVRADLAPILCEAREKDPLVEPASVLVAAFASMSESQSGGLASRVSAIRWQLTPYYSVEMHSDRPTTVLVRQTFDFAAAHRLHTHTLTDDENRRLFGKCNNPSGHGHNYRVEPCVEVALDRNGQQAFTLGQLESLVGTTIISRFDHTHLNLDTAEFGPRGVNPTVENIARVFFDLLAPEIKRVCPGANLRAMTVWETDRTSCTYSPG